MPAVLDYPRQQAAETLVDSAAGEYGQAQGTEGAQLSEKARRAVRDQRDVACQRFYTRRTNPHFGIQQAIENSRSLLQLEDDWDTEGSPAIDEATWNRAVEFLKNHADQVWRCHGTEIDPPHIGPGPDGSVDLHWDLPEYELLINFPTDADAMAGCYGDDRGKIQIKATVDPKTTNEGLLLWLKKAT